MENGAEITNQIALYRQLLLHSLSVEKEKRYINLYKLHEAELTLIENAFLENDIASLKKLIKSEVHGFGWSFLPEQHGENVENAFWKLNEMINPED